MFLQYLRFDEYDVLRVNRSGDYRWAEVRGKKGYISTGYDESDPLHSALDGLGKCAQISDLMNGTVVTLNPTHPDYEKAKTVCQRILK